MITSWSGIVSELHREVKGAATPEHADILAGNLTHDSRSALALGLPQKCLTVSLTVQEFSLKVLGSVSILSSFSDLFRIIHQDFLQYKVQSAKDNYRLTFG